MCRSAKDSSDGIARRCAGADKKTNARRRAIRAEAKNPESAPAVEAAPAPYVTASGLKLLPPRAGESWEKDARADIERLGEVSPSRVANLSVRNQGSLAAVALDPEILMAVAKTRSPRVKEMLASRPELPAEAIKHLMKSKDKSLLRSLASNPATSEDDLFKLAKSESYYVREGVYNRATNENNQKLIDAVRAAS